MEKSEISPINSYVLDTSIEEFNKEELKEAGVLIDYDQYMDEGKVKVDGDKKQPKKRQSRRLIFLASLLICLFIIMLVGHFLINERKTNDGSDYLVIECLSNDILVDSIQLINN